MGLFGYPSRKVRAADAPGDDTFAAMAPSEVTGAQAIDAPSAAAGYHATLDHVALIARHAAGGGDPAQVSRRAFDRARIELGLRDEVPTPQGLQHRLGRPFASIVSEALAPIASRVALIGPDQPGQVQATFPDELMVLALVACRRGLGAVPSPADYDTWAAEFTIHRERTGAAPNPLPHSARYVKRYGSWPRALHAAGLIDDPDAHAEQRRIPPPLAETISRCLDELGVLPSEPLLYEWARRRGVQVSREDMANATRAYEQCHTARTAEGKWTPTKRTAINKAPSLDDLPDAGDGPSRRVKVGGWTLDELIEAMRVYMTEYLVPGEAPRQKSYRAAAKKNNADPTRPLMPAASMLLKARDAKGNAIGFQELARLAEGRR